MSAMSNDCPEGFQTAAFAWGLAVREAPFTPDGKSDDALLCVCVVDFCRSRTHGQSESLGFILSVIVS
jgi:hypothetical protein